jgi:hypothetical protein
MSFDASFDVDSSLPPAGEPDFSQLLRVLRREEPDRPTLFEFFLDRKSVM